MPNTISKEDLSRICMVVDAMLGSPKNTDHIFNLAKEKCPDLKEVLEVIKEKVEYFCRSGKLSEDKNETERLVSATIEWAKENRMLMSRRRRK